MMQIINGELRVKLEDKEVTDNGLVPVILKRYERVIEENAMMVYEIKKLKETPKTPFSFSPN